MKIVQDIIEFLPTLIPLVIVLFFLREIISLKAIAICMGILVIAFILHHLFQLSYHPFGVGYWIISAILCGALLISAMICNYLVIKMLKSRLKSGRSNEQEVRRNYSQNHSDIYNSPSSFTRTTTTHTNVITDVDENLKWNVNWILTVKYSLPIILLVIGMSLLFFKHIIWLGILVPLIMGVLLGPSYEDLCKDYISVKTDELVTEKRSEVGKITQLHNDYSYSIVAITDNSSVIKLWKGNRILREFPLSQGTNSHDGKNYAIINVDDVKYVYDFSSKVLLHAKKDVEVVATNLEINNLLSEIAKHVILVKGI